MLLKDIIHQREVTKIKEQPKWIIRDTIFNKPDSISMKQLWHLPLQHSDVLWKSLAKNEEPIIQQNANRIRIRIIWKKGTL